MGTAIFYIVNFIGITVYYLFGRKGNADSPSIMLPYIISIGIIFMAVIKYLMQNKSTVSEYVFATVILVFLCVVMVCQYSSIITDFDSFNYAERVNSLRRYFGVFIFFLAFIGLNTFTDLDKVGLISYLKFVILLVAGEAILEFMLLNVGIISHLDLPVQVGAEYIGSDDITFRPYGFLGATSSLGVFLLILFYLSYGLKDELPKWTWILSFVAFAVSFAVTAYAIFIIISFLSLLLKVRAPIKMFLALVLVGGGVVGLCSFINLLLPGKMNLDYFLEMIWVVWALDVEHYLLYANGFWDVFLGAQPFNLSFGVLSQDLPYVSWLGEVGLLGVFIYSFLSTKMLMKLHLLIPKKYVYAVILCIFLGMLHYPIIIFIPTQVFLGSLMFFAYKVALNGPIRKQTSP